MKTTKQRGSGWSIKLVFNLYKIFGYKFIYFLMYPVSFFYFIFAKNVKESLKIYYKHLEIPFNNSLYYNHLRIFAVCMVDRFISKVSPQSYEFIYKDKEELTNILNDGTILLFSHYGGWATASNSPLEVKNKINIVMQEVLLDAIKSIENSLDTQNNDVEVIDLNEGGIVSSIKIANALINNEIVAIMGDRVNNQKHYKKMQFFDGFAEFNKNPFQIAYKLNKPILVFFAINVGLQKYKIEYLKINLDTDKKKGEAIEIAMKEYIEFFEVILKNNPQQWFNFYNFWE